MSRPNIISYHEQDPDEPAWAHPDLREPSYSQSIERGLAILGCFTPERPILGITDVANKLNMQRSTTYRYMFTLTELGYLTRAPHKKYRLSLDVTKLGMSALHTAPLQAQAQPYMEELSRQVACSVSLAMLDGLEILYVERLRNPLRERKDIDLNLGPEARLPAHCTAMGKILLASLPSRELYDRLKGVKLTAITSNTITVKWALQNELERVEEESLAVNDGELVPGFRAIAVPVRDASNEVIAAMALTAHENTIGLDELINRLGPHLRVAADKLSARLGYRRP